VRKVRESARRRSPHVSRGALVAIPPGQDVAVGQQFPVHRDGGPADQAAPLACLIWASSESGRPRPPGHVDREARPRYLQVAAVVDGSGFDRRCVAATGSPRITPGYGPAARRHLGHWMPGRTAIGRYHDASDLLAARASGGPLDGYGRTVQQGVTGG